MKFKEIMNIPGMSGLYKLVASNKGGFIVESLADGKRFPISSTHKVMMVSDIAIFTSGDDLPLIEVMKKISETDGDKLSVDPKAEPEALKTYFKKLVPEMDEERVHGSHMKKILTWYEILRGKIDFNEKEEEEDAADALKKDEQGKPVAKAHETNAPKETKHAKTATVKLRKKV